jgi:hypothetical protein
MVTGIECLLTDLRTGEEIKIPSIARARKYMNVDTNIIYGRLAVQEPLIINGYKLERIKNNGGLKND